MMAKSLTAGCAPEVFASRLVRPAATALDATLAGSLTVALTPALTLTLALALALTLILTLTLTLTRRLRAGAGR